MLYHKISRAGIAYWRPGANMLRKNKSTNCEKVFWGGIVLDEKVKCPHCTPLQINFELLIDDCILCDGRGVVPRELAAAYVLIVGDRQFCDPQEVLSLRIDLDENALGDRIFDNKDVD